MGKVNKMHATSNPMSAAALLQSGELEYGNRIKYIGAPIETFTKTQT